MEQIDLSQITTQKSRVLAGHQRGVAAREFYKLDKLEKENNIIALLAPATLDTISPSFVQGFLGESALHFDKEKLQKWLDLSLLAPYLREDIEMGLRTLFLRQTKH